MNRFPAEWEKQSAVLISWPHNTGDFSNRLESVEQSYSIIADTITEYQPLIIVCRDDSHQQHIQTLVSNHKAIDFIHATVNDIWVRDTVFLSVEKEGAITHLNFLFNGWGEKYQHQNDNALNHKLLNEKPFKGKAYKDVDFILEGGSVESDGIDTILTTKQCLLNPNRNKGLTQQEIEQQLLENLGAKRVLWLDQENLSGDDTDAHIDTLARFCSVNTIAYTSCKDPDDQHYTSLKYMKMQLQDFRNQAGDPYHLVSLPLPKPIYDEEGQQLPANYANFLIINHAVLVPVYGDPMDDIALTRLAECFPEHKIIPIPCRPLVHQYGSLHCMTMQFPEGVLVPAV
ncbi:agmatine deiminase family protein [Methylobacter sp. S3L5C]|uniref:agmatine deiminase family protein n=1 Tax=Methylobacter sp. S3L5C TaxID=2839024 RepID=UPI001FADE8C7|nr:agmatine deiminase family protein [Methylobacter sp. S3L5C]UOA07477.1 agmatine deiminase family protein [Methylobacter sp. S3L5C]